jgi:hypothetical protein
MEDQNNKCPRCRKETLNRIVHELPIPLETIQCDWCDATYDTFPGHDPHTLANLNYQENYMGEPLTQDSVISSYMDGYRAASERSDEETAAMMYDMTRFITEGTLRKWTRKDFLAFIRKNRNKDI